ncbi:Undecaprenyl-phosphate N-acetylglucosaminyl 1-phosphate transferase [Thioalkalivibrio nitratireducens DSM 14787]|uniref:Undecaprenyl-phosphate N-acetylglucosaminyl 1-phosphate transferase n=1 Tax=Thioalkalivibrio nitratireducens (strain DSM 14787 / UNIQEM 213 / ALEN2) TaxID=1255043 RepID=L0DXG3_THIND|nr:Undecaprenyl-phosphate N-acetylglucosaminyl 1-phosphate transferase [Thioalkalivibrio nitratireducens DSM 14787]
MLAALIVAAALTPVNWWALWSLPLGVVVLGLLGLVDDLFDIGSAIRLLAQLGVAWVMAVAGVQIASLGNLLGTGPLNLGWIGPAFTILCVAFMINAINMMDGIDGLAGSISLLAAVGLSVLAVSAGMGGKAAAGVLLASGLAAFLLFNLRSPWLRRAAVFLGDSGSMVLGFVLAWLAVAITQPAASGVAPVSIAFLLLLPAADSLGVFVRRLRRGRNPLAADRTHLHHVLCRAGLPVTTVVLLIAGNQLVLVLLALACHFGGCPEPLQFAMVTLLLLAYVGFSLNAHHFLRAMLRGRRRRLASGGLKPEIG